VSHTHRVVTGMRLLCQTLPRAAAEATTVPELGRMVSDQVAPVVPHDGYILVGMDPVSTVGCFLTRENSYGAQVLSRMSIDFALGRSSPIRLLAHGEPDRRYPAQLQTMAAEGFGSEIRIELTQGGRDWGVLVLLRERGRTSFSAADTAHAERLAQPLALALKRFVAATALSSMRSDLPPGLIIVGHADDIRVATPTGRDALRAYTPDRMPTDAELFVPIWNITYRARRAGGPIVCRVLAPQGWIALHAEPLPGTPVGEVAVTTQPASAEVLLPAITAWHDITRRERTVIEQALEGISARQIARRLDLSPHTINDHFKAIYRKIGVTSREELITRLCR
jgi:DNA-binding CsgD family transcriptional regulator